ncbi:MAG: tRNA (guanine(46)-N(7))-methyltransferase TrmB [Albidovulum sp.]|nr:tRNA (guanine(46)-N(7))-methyltransferase TrmB [Albidovulum sp.]
MDNSRRPGHGFRNLYGRRRGKRLRHSQIARLNDELPKFEIPASFESNPDRSLLDRAGIFGADLPIWLEIGFGSGEHLLRQAELSPDIGLIGCEPYLNGVASLLGKLQSRPLGNIRIYPGDVRDILDVLPDGSIERVFLLYPDPWPKKRHRGRRIVNSEYLDPLARVMRRGAELRLATDIPNYAAHAVETILLRSDLEWTARSPEDWRLPWPGWRPTRYERKAVEAGRKPIYLIFRRK